MALWARFAIPGPQYAFTAKQTANIGQFRSTLYQNPTLAALELWDRTGAMSGRSERSSNEIRFIVVTFRTRVRNSGSLDVSFSLQHLSSGEVGCGWPAPLAVDSPPN